MPHPARPRRAPAPLLLLAAALLACATARPPAGPPELRFAPEEPLPSALERELQGMDAEALQAAGEAAVKAGDHPRAAAAFARLADAFPASPRAPDAQLEAALAYRRLGAWRLALERFRARERLGGDPGALEASFGVAECLYQLGDGDAARAALDAIAARPDAGAEARVRALAQRGVVELDQGRPDEAERSLRSAVDAWEAARAAGPIPPTFAAQARFYLGEVGRERLRALPLDPSSGDAGRLQAALERKAEALLAAQEHYLGAIRAGDPEWAVAAGFRVGELYEELRRELLEAPLPPGLDAAGAEAYRAELRGRVRVLAGKAVSAYRQTLDFARSAGLDDPAFLADARAALERLEQAAAPEGEDAPGR